MKFQVTLKKVKGLANEKRECDAVFFSSYKWSFISYKNIIEMRDKEKWILV